MRDAIAAVIMTAVFLAAGATCADADDRLKYCKDLRTGEIIVVEIGYPCPGTTSEL